MLRMLLAVLAIAALSCDSTHETITVDVDEDYFKNHIAVQDPNGLYYYGFRLDGADVLLMPDKAKWIDLRIDAGETYPGLDSLVITAEPVTRTGATPVHRIEGVILSGGN